MGRVAQALSGGTRVRIDAPGWSVHRAVGTVACDMATAGHPCFVLRDGFGRHRDGVCTVGPDEVVRLREQAPNPAHAGPFDHFWWLKTNEGEVRP